MVLYKHMSDKIEQILIKIIKIGVIIILFLPILVYKQVLFPYVFAKILVFQIMVEIILAIWLVLVVNNQAYKVNWKNPLIMAVTTFMGMLTLTMFTGVDISKSFFGNQERMSGLFSVLHFYAFFIILTSIFKQWKDWQKIIWSSLFCSVLVGVYGLGQKLGLDLLIKNKALQMNSTFGNPIYLAVYSMLNIFLAIILLLKEKIKLSQILAGLVVVFNLIIMLLAASRGVILAFGGSLCLFFILLVFLSQSKKIKIGLSFLIIIIVSCFILIQIPQIKTQLTNAPIFVRRLAYFFNSSKSRLISWEIGWQGFKEKPLTGWGWENYDVVFNKHYDPWYLSKGYNATWFDRSHNQVIDLLAMTGILGVLSYLIIFGIVFWLLFKKIKILDNLKQKIPFILLVLMFLAYFIQNLFVFDTPSALIVFYVGLGLVYFFTKQPVSQISTPAPKYFPLPLLIFLIIICLPWIMYEYNIKPFYQSKLAMKGNNATKIINLKAGLPWYEKSLQEQSFVNPEIATQMSMKIAVEYKDLEKADLPTLKQATELAIREYEQSVMQHPFNARLWLYLGQLYGLGSNYNRNYIDKAEECLIKAKNLSPRRQQVYFELSRIYGYRNEYSQAVDFLKQAMELDTSIATPITNLKRFLTALEEIDPELVATTREWLTELNKK